MTITQSTISKSTQTVEKPTSAFIYDSEGNRYQVSFEIVTPDASRAYRSKRVGNRKETNIDKYGADMVNGRWTVTGQPIIFDENDELNDGNNRTGASDKFNVSFETLVVRGVQTAAHLNIDTGASRTLLNALQFINHNLSESEKMDYIGTVGYMLKRIVQVDMGRAVASNSFTTRSEELEALKTYKSGTPECAAGVEDIVALVQHFKVGRELLGFLTWLYSRKAYGYKGKMKEFLEAYQPKDPSASTKWNHPAQVLYRKLSKSNLNKSERLGVAMAAINSYILDNPLPKTATGDSYLKVPRLFEVGDTGEIIRTSNPKPPKTKRAVAGN
jgi:hypothetical protein